MIINVFTFFVVVLLPGACILWLLNLNWFKKWELQAGGSLWLAVPTSLAISTSLVSILGWTGYYLRLSFYEVRFFFISILLLLSLASLIKLWHKRQDIKISISDLRIKNFSYKSWEFVVFVFIVVVLILAIYGGTWFSHTADSFNHMAAVRSLIKYNNPLPMQIHWDVPVSGMDPTFGTWHLTLAIWASLTGMDMTTMWLLATIMIAPLIIVTFVALAVELTHSKFAAFMAGLLYVIIDLSGDFRVSAQSNRMGQIVFWLIFIYLILAVDSYSKNDNRSGLIFTSFSALFAWSSSAVHLQYGPALIGIIVPTILLSVLISVYNKSRINRGSGKIGEYSWQAISGVGGVLLLGASFSFIIRSSFALAEKNPVLTQQSLSITGEKPFALIYEDLNIWFSRGDLFIIIASILSLAMVYFAIKGNLGAVFVFISSILVPVYVTITTLFFGRGGLLFSTFYRLILLTPPLLVIGWAWALAIAFKYILSQRLRILTLSNLKFLAACLAVVLSVIPIYSQITNPKGGVISIYSRSSNYKFKLRTSQDSSLLSTRQDAIQSLYSVPDDARILADERTGYEMMGLTGKYFFRLPSQHTPLQEKDFNNEAYWDVLDFTSGESDKRQMVEILTRQQVSYVYVDKEKYQGPMIWEQLDSMAILDEVGSGENWRLYQFDPQSADEYLILDDQINQASNFLEKLELNRKLEAYFSDHDRYVRELMRSFPLDASVVYDFVQEGQNYLRPREAGTTYNFLLNLDKAKIKKTDKNNVKRTAFIIYGDTRGVIFQHPRSQILYTVNVPQDSRLDFSIALDPAVWEMGLGDGVEFRIAINNFTQKRLVFNEYIDPKNLRSDRRWFHYSLDLSFYSGQTVEIIFETLPGPHNSSRFDWAGWGEPSIRYNSVNNLISEWDTLTIENIDGAEVKKTVLQINGDKRYLMFQHPISRVSTKVYIPPQAELHFGLAMDPDVWENGKSDGVLYRIFIEDSRTPGVTSNVFDYFLSPGNPGIQQDWLDFALNLAAFGGREVNIIFETSPGPNNDPSYDWGGWSTPYIVEVEATQ